MCCFPVVLGWVVDGGCFMEHEMVIDGLFGYLASDDIPEVCTFLPSTLAAKQSSLEYGQDLPIVQSHVFLYADIEIDSIETVSAGCIESAWQVRRWQYVAVTLYICCAYHYRICMYLPDSKEMASFCCSYTMLHLST